SGAATTARSALSLRAALPICALEDAVDAAAQGGGQHGLLLVEPDHFQRLLADIGLDSADDLLAAAAARLTAAAEGQDALAARFRSEEHTSELQSRENLVCRLL